MKYTLSNSFTPIDLTAGTIQNVSQVSTVEISNSIVPNSGLLLDPREKITFSGENLYARCTGLNGAEIRVTPFFVNNGGGTSQGGSSSSTRFATDDEVDEIINNYFP